MIELTGEFAEKHLDNADEFQETISILPLYEVMIEKALELLDNLENLSSEGERTSQLAQNVPEKQWKHGA